MVGSHKNRSLRLNSGGCFGFGIEEDKVKGMMRFCRQVRFTRRVERL